MDGMDGVDGAWVGRGGACGAWMQTKKTKNRRPGDFSQGRKSTARGRTTDWLEANRWERWTEEGDADESCMVSDESCMEGVLMGVGALGAVFS